MLRTKWLPILVTIIGIAVPLKSHSAEAAVMSRRGLLGGFLAVVAASQIPEISLVYPSTPWTPPPEFSMLTQEFAEIRNVRHTLLTAPNPESPSAIQQFSRSLEQLDLRLPESQAYRNNLVQFTKVILDPDLKQAVENGNRTRARMGRNLMYDLVLLRSALPVPLLNKISRHNDYGDQPITLQPAERQLIKNYLSGLEQLEKRYPKTDAGYELLNSFISDARSWHPSCSRDLR